MRKQILSGLSVDQMSIEPIFLHTGINMKQYRVAILGCRSRGTSAARVYYAHPRTQVVGLCDLLEDRLNTLGDELNIDARFTDLDEMIRQTQPGYCRYTNGACSACTTGLAGAGTRRQHRNRKADGIGFRGNGCGDE